MYRVIPQILIVPCEFTVKDRKRNSHAKIVGTLAKFLTTFLHIQGEPKVRDKAKSYYGVPPSKG